MSDTKNSMQSAGPQERPTVKMEPPPDWAIALGQKMADGFERVDTRFDAVEGNQKLQGGQVLDLGRRMTALEGRVGGVEERQNNNSVRAKEPSQHDIEIRAELQAERTAREALATKVDSIVTKTDAQTKMLETISTSVVDSVKGFWKRNPKLETALAGLILAALAYAYAALSRGQLP